MIKRTPEHERLAKLALEYAVRDNGGQTALAEAFRNVLTAEQRSLGFKIKGRQPKL